MIHYSLCTMFMSLFILKSTVAVTSNCTTSLLPSKSVMEFIIMDYTAVNGMTNHTAASIQDGPYYVCLTHADHDSVDTMLPMVKELSILIQYTTGSSSSMSYNNSRSGSNDVRYGLFVLECIQDYGEWRVSNDTIASLGNGSIAELQETCTSSCSSSVDCEACNPSCSIIKCEAIADNWPTITCNNNTTCSANNTMETDCGCGYMCLDGHTYDSQHCTCTLTDICVADNPCNNNGVCILDTAPDQYTCNCTGTGYTGTNCTVITRYSQQFPSQSAVSKSSVVIMSILSTLSHQPIASTSSSIGLISNPSTSPHTVISDSQELVIIVLSGTMGFILLVLILSVICVMMIRFSSNKKYKHNNADNQLAVLVNSSLVRPMDRTSASLDTNTSNGTTIVMTTYDQKTFAYNDGDAMSTTTNDYEKHSFDLLKDVMNNLPEGYFNIMAAKDFDVTSACNSDSASVVDGEDNTVTSNDHNESINREGISTDKDCPLQVQEEYSRASFDTSTDIKEPAESADIKEPAESDQGTPQQQCIGSNSNGNVIPGWNTQLSNTVSNMDMPSPAS